MRLHTSLLRPAILVALAAALLSGGCKTYINEPLKPEEMPVAHVVMVWLKTPGDATARERIVKRSLDFYGEVPGLLSVDGGQAIRLGRPGMDETYDLGVVMIFENKAALQGYLTSAVHQRAVNDVLNPLASKVVTYDFTLQRQAYDGVFLVRPRSEQYSSPNRNHAFR
jgi:hypothetical protein